jgi:hypothetical protein
MTGASEVGLGLEDRKGGFSDASGLPHQRGRPQVGRLSAKRTCAMRSLARQTPALRFWIPHLCSTRSLAPGRVRFVPREAKLARRRRPAHLLHPTDRPPLEQSVEAAAQYGPRRPHLLDPMLGALVARHIGFEDRAELAGIQVPPPTRVRRSMAPLRSNAYPPRKTGSVLTAV